MKVKHIVFLAAFLLGLASLGYSQTPIYRYATLTNSYGSVFFALNGSTGQLFYMRDMGDAAGKWIPYGQTLRPEGKNNLEFFLVAREKGTDFYVIDGTSGQLYWSSDFDDNAGVWHTFGSPIRTSDRANLRFAVEPQETGNKFTAIDADTGQVYYMFDLGEEAGKWKAYGEAIK